MSPGIYVMSPRFISDLARRDRLTRAVRVVKVEAMQTEEGPQDFIWTVELTTSSHSAWGKPIWERGEESVKQLDVWEFSPVSEEGTRE